MHRRHPTTIFFIVLFLLLTAFAPLYATALPEGRTLDEGHESGYIDWSGPVGYTNFWHRDALCYDGCFEEVTQISSGGSVSGSFQSGVDVNYFEVMVARSGAGGFGTATLTACSSTTSVYLGTGGAIPGFNSLLMYVPPGCTSWSLSASGGNVYFRSVDANYNAPSLPPVISGNLACTSPGNGGWCLGGQSLHLEASDPQSQPIIIYGKISGVDFSCPGGATTCDVPVTVEGAGTAEFTVLNPATGLSDSDSLPYHLDTSTPQVDLTITGASGSNGWYVSSTQVTASATDAISGLASLEVAVDGGAWQPNGPLTLSDGMHTVAARAYDIAGNVTEITQNINVDTLTPTLNISVNGVAGENGWYVSAVQVSANATDAGSGLASLEVSADGGAWQVYSPQSLSDGVHALQFRATDNAGNVTTTNQEVRVDTLTPSLSLTVSGTAGLNGWYVSAVQVSATATDAGSGTGTIEALVNGGAWSAFSAPLSFTDGVYSYQVQVRDQAGNVTQTPVQSLKVDTIAPFIDMPKSITLGKKLEYTLRDDGSGLAIYRAVIEDDAEHYQKIVWLKTLSGNIVEDDILWDGKFKDGTQAAPGEYFITLKISDAAGNERIMTTVVKVNVLNSLLPIPPFVPPTSAPEPVSTPQAEPTPATFGGQPGVPTGQPAPFTFSAGGGSAGGKPATTQTVSQSSQNTNVPISTSGILWGAASAAAVGYFVSETQKRKEEEEQKRREAAEAQQQALAQMFLEDTKPEPKEEKPPRGNKKNNTLTEQERLQAIWDANGARLYEMKQAELKAAATQPKKSAASAPAKQNLWNKVTSAGKAVYAPVASTIKKVVMPVKSTPAPAVSAPAKPSLWNKFTSAVKKVVTPIVSTVKKVVTPSVNAVKKVVMPIVNSVKKVVTPIVNTVKKVVTPIVNTVKKVVTPIVNTVKKVVTPIVNTVKKVVTPIVNTVKKVVTPIVNAVKNVVTSVVNTVKKVVAPIVNTVKNVATSVVNTVKNVFQEHPAAAWTAATTLTTAAAVGTYVMICGVPKFIQPVASVFQIAGVFSLPLTGWLTTNKKQRVYGILIGMLFCGMILSACGGGQKTPTCAPTDVPTILVTETPLLPTLVPPTTTLNIDEKWVQPYTDSFTLDNLKSNYSGLVFVDAWINTNAQWLSDQGYNEKFYQDQGYPNASAYWQNHYNDAILAAAKTYGIPPLLLKGLIMQESNESLTPIPFVNKPQGSGLTQLTMPGADMLFTYLPKNTNANALNGYYSYYNVIYETAINGRLAWFDSTEPVPYDKLTEAQKIAIQTAAQQIFDGECEDFEVLAGLCVGGSTAPILSNGANNINVGALTLLSTQQALTTPDYTGYTYITQENWEKLSKEDQWKIMIVTYKEGFTIIGNAVQQAKDINNGQIENWEQVATQIKALDKDCSSNSTDCGSYYVDQVQCYADNVPNGGTPCGAK